jgi:hypothetical protein
MESPQYVIGRIRYQLELKVWLVRGRQDADMAPPMQQRLAWRVARDKTLEQAPATYQCQIDE